MDNGAQMPSIVGHQKVIIERVLELIRHSREYPSILIKGNTGGGKRTVARGIATTLGIDFLEVPLSGPSKDLRVQLYGAAIDATVARSEGRPPGELGRAESLMLYFSRLEQLPEDFYRELFTLVTRRVYDDGRGRRWRLADDVLIVSALTALNTSEAELPMNWLHAGFKHHIKLDLLSSVEEMKETAEAILDDIGCKAKLDEDAAGELLMAMRLSRRGLTATKEWLWTIAGQERPAVEGRISVEDVRAVLDMDLEMILNKLTYRGHPVTIKRYSRWRDQFPCKGRYYAQKIVKSIAADYYVSERLYFNLLQQLVEQTGLGMGARVMFCRWQMIGRSSERVANDLKNLAAWQLGPDVDLLKDPSFWPKVERSGRHNFVLADDFVGSGKTVRTLINGDQRSSVLRLLSEFPESHVWILIVAGYTEGFSEIRRMIRSFTGIHLIVGRLFGEEDRCLSPKSKIFTAEEDRQNVKALCRQIRADFYPGLPENFTYGFGDIASLVVYHNTVPNNSLPLLWQNRGTWIPLFPASGLL